MSKRNGVMSVVLTAVMAITAVPMHSAEAKTTRKTSRTAKSTKSTKRRTESRSIYKSCAEAKRAGATPLRRGQRGYSVVLDKDGDGVACEG